MMDVDAAISRLPDLSADALGYRFRSLWTFVTRSGRLAGWCQSGSGLCLCAAIAASAWLTGGIQPWAIYLIATVLASAAGLWAVSRWTERPIDLTRSWCVCFVLVAAIVGVGIASLFHATNSWNPIDKTLVGPVAPSRWLPSTVFRRATLYWLIQVGPVLAGLVVMVDLGRNVLWRNRFIASLAGSGIVLSLYGALQHAGLFPLSAAGALFPKSVFGAFNNHGNAGAWLNLALPAAIAMAAVGPPLQRRSWLIGAGIITGGAIINVSKAASLLALLILALVSTGMLLRRYSSGVRVDVKTVLRRLGATMLCIILFAWITGRLHSWADMPKTIEAESGRRVMWGISRHIAQDSGAFGHGAGSFKALFPTTIHFDPAIYMRWAVTRYTPGEAVSVWSYPCNDLLQSWIEWGPAGTLLGLLIPAGAGLGMLRGLKYGDQQTASLAGISLIALAVVALHALGDFPLQILSIQIAATVYLAIGWTMLSGDGAFSLTAPQATQEG